MCRSDRQFAARTAAAHLITATGASSINNAASQPDLHVDSQPPTDLDRARDALKACDPACDRDEWLRLAMAAKAAGVDLDTFDAWSATATSYSERDTRSVWNSIRRDDGIGPGTLFKVAAQAGWNPAGRRQQARPGKAPARPQAAPQRPRPGMGAAEVWARSEPAPASHGYIEAKQGRPEGLRVVPAADPLRIAGASVAG